MALPFLTIAYIPERAPGAHLALVAMGCTDIAMGPKAEFGDFEPLLQQRAGRIRATVSTCCKSPSSAWLMNRDIPSWRFGDVGSGLDDLPRSQPKGLPSGGC